MNNNIRFELSFKNISQLENKLNFCKLNNIKNINIPCKGVIKKELFNSTIKYISNKKTSYSDKIKIINSIKNKSFKKELKKIVLEYKN